MPSRALPFLLASQNADGGWGYGPGRDSTVEATAATLLALGAAEAAAGVTDAHARGLAWLLRGQHPDGGWGVSQLDPGSGWATAWALLALARSGGGPQAVARAASWMLAVPTLRLTDDELQREIARDLAIDASLRGWPWRPGQASWVEPTALALLALQAVSLTPAIGARLAEAVRYLQDRRCVGGGWNFGNPVMLGKPLPARAHPTAWVILALNAQDPAQVQAQDVAALRGDMHSDGGALALAWGLLALRSRGEDDPAAAERLAALQGEDGGWRGNPYHTALASMAAARQAVV